MFYAPGQDIQRPTHPRLHVRDTRDAQTVLEAVRRGLLKPVSRRLNEMERSMYIQSGSIFVWEESDDELGLKRWTDGKMWSQSRMREPYLFYDEKVANESTDNPGNQSPSTQAVFRFVDGKSRASSASSILTHFDRSAHRPSGLVKQAYSALVMVSPGSQPRKWHLTAYFTYDDLQHLPSIDNDPTLRSIIVPEGVYRSGKARTRNSDFNSNTMPQLSGVQNSLVSTSVPAPNLTGASGSKNQSHALPTPSLPPLHTAVHRGEGLPSPVNPQREARWSEDQKIIQMLNSRHIR